MLTPNFIFKLIMTPLIILAATLVVRRWGERIGGLMVGLPMTSAPVSIFFAIEQGRAFAAGAARGAILGLLPVVAFCTAYFLTSKRLSWKFSAPISICLYLISVWGVSFLTLDFGVELVLIPAVIAAVILILGKSDKKVRQITSPWWDLPARMLIATSLLVFITNSAGILGPKWGGLLSPFPIFTFVMATFSHSQGGPAAAWRLIRGVLIGLFSYTAFFVVVALSVEQLNLFIVYPLAILASLSINGISLAFMLRRNRLAVRDTSAA
jgi:hypothetical protein